ncbi:OsmC family peroxiredoxin [Ostreiculturibacter nitratireducens]|uniref:OsmC family peroxiredoxin n=1 Tax=Ostreiculturibacter nitratireducens TaxID=3075226 RepID=UPI0031B5A174
MIAKHGSAVWNGSLKQGGGTVSTQSGALSGLSYTHAMRFGDAKGTNPEELIGAAHAACFSMFLAALMGGEEIVPDAIETTSTISLDATTEGGPTVKKAHLVTSVRAAAPEAKIRVLADKAKAGCPISKLLNAEVTIEVKIG